MKFFSVEWVGVIEAENELEAASEAWAQLDQAIRTNQGATMLSVSDEFGENNYSIDMAKIVECDVCTKAYENEDEAGYCFRCGNCVEHTIAYCNHVLDSSQYEGEADFAISPYLTEVN